MRHGDRATLLMLTTDRSPGGIQTALAAYLEGLAQLGHRTILAAPAGAPIFAGNVHGARPLPFGRLAPLGLALGVGPLARAARSADLVVVHNNRLAAPVRRLGRPVVAVAHGDKAKGLGRASAVVVLSTAFARQLRAMGIPAAAVHHVPHALPAGSGARPAQPRGAPAHVTIVAAGRFVAKKGFADWLDALARAGLDWTRTRAVLAGMGPLAPALRARAQRLGVPVAFPGWVPIHDLLATADVFCLPSRDEPFGLVLLEAMAAGVACVASATHGPSDIVTDGIDGLLHPPGDATALAERLRYLVADASARARLGAAARITARGPRYTRARFTADLARVIDSCLAG